MKSDVEIKLEKNAEIWNYYIWEYKFCNNKIKFNQDAQTNYFGDILGYFHDTFDLVFSEKESNSFSGSFTRNLSLLQAVYIHQDFIEELLILFKCNISKGDLKKDLNYSINRDIRNELVGHPIRKSLKGRKLISSTSFAYNAEKGSLKYLRYHKDNNFKFEEMTFQYSDIIERHGKFLNTYFDIILENLKSILHSFIKELGKIENLMKTHDFETMLNFASKAFESIFKNDYIYDKQSLLLIYKKRLEHKRYQNHIDLFLANLKGNLTDTKQNISDLFEPIEIIKEEPIERLPFEIIFDTSDSDKKAISTKEKITYHYEIGKLATRKDSSFHFDFASSVLRSKCAENNIVLDELNHMEQNFYNEIEYYCSLNLIRFVLNEI